MKIYCCVCGRQIIKSGEISDRTTSPPVTLMGPNQYACSVCASELDENGLFPGESGYKENE